MEEPAHDLLHPEDMGLCVKIIREKSGFSRETLETRSGVPRSVIYRLETSHKVLRDLRYFGRLLRAMPGQLTFAEAAAFMEEACAESEK